MKFLKGMLGRPSQALDRYGPNAAMEDLRGDDQQDWDDYGPFEDTRDGDEHDREASGAEDAAPTVASPGEDEANSNVTDFPMEASVEGAPVEKDEPEAEAMDKTEEARVHSRPESMKIWELFDEDKETLDGQGPEEELAVPQKSEEQREVSERSMAREALAMIQARSPEALRDLDASGTSPGRAKTRIIGFAGRNSGPIDLFKQKSKPLDQGPKMFPVGWLIIIEGPGRGASFTLFSGLTQIGRSEDQSISLNFGDHAISRENHASIAYDDEDNVFYLGHGGKANIVRLNGRPVLSTEEISNGDLIRIGETTLRFVALCGSDFAWDLTEEGDD